jgi:hypothetical protein
MQVEHCSNEELSLEEIEQLDKLRRIIETAVSDGKLSHYQLEHIKSIAFANKKLLLEELQLYRKLILDKIDQRELEYEW